MPRALALLLSLLVVRAAAAHDFWLEPSTYRPGISSTLTIGLRVGDGFPRGDPYPRNPAHVRQFVLKGPSVTRPVGGRVGEDPAGRVAVEEAGVLVIGYRSTRSTIELEAERFEAYLREERLDRVSRWRAAHGEASAPGREVFSRAAKAIVRAGEGGGAVHDRPLGLTLEIVPERDPYAMRPGDALPVRVLHDGAPLADARVVARSVEGAHVETRTDAAGHARLALDDAGVWLVRCLHMQRAPADVDADWESFWASLTFELPDDS